MNDWLKIAIQAGVIIVGLSAAYYKLDSRVTLTEQAIIQETQGYQTLLSTFNSRMDKFEKKIDCMVDDKFCH